MKQNPHVRERLNLYGFRVFLAVLFAGMVSAQGMAMAVDGMITVKSNHDVATTMDKLQAIVESNGMGFARQDQTVVATYADIELRPTQTLIFGTPKARSPLMKCSQSIAVDLPLRALVWEDENGEVWLGYNDPAYLKSRHATEGCDKVFANLAGAWAEFSEAATAP